MSVTTKVNFRTFQPPPNYTEKTDYSEEQLFLEDLNNEDNEVWLFQTPREFDSSSLKNKTISLQGETVFQNDNCLQAEKSHKISASTNSVNEIGYQLLLPSRSITGLFPVSLPFAGHLRLMETISTPPLASPYFPPEKEEEDFSNLRQRYVPFGSDKPFPIKATSHNSVNGKNSWTPTSSKKKRVLFKFPLTETQEENIPEVENNYQSALNKDNLHKTTKQKKLLGNNTSQENAMPKEVKSKKKKHNRLSSNDSAATDDPSNESNDSSLQTEQFEEAESSQNHTLFCSDSRSLKENESFSNGDTQVSSTSKTSRKKRKSDKSSRDECAKDGVKISENIQQNTVSQDEEIFGNMPDGIVSGSDSSQSDTKSKKKKKKSKEQTDENYPASEETELSHTTRLIQYSKTSKQNKNDGTVLPGNDNYQTDTKPKKNKRKSNQFENVSNSGETKSSCITQLNQSSESNVSPQNHSNKNFTKTNFSPTTDNKIEPFANEAENANSCKQDLSYTDTQKPHKKVKRKKLSEGDGSQDDTSKSRKRKVSDKFWANSCTDTSDEKSSFNDSLIKSQQNDISQSFEHSCHSSDTNILPVQGELSENERHDTEDTKSKRKKNRSKSASLKEDAKMYGLVLPSDKKESVPAHSDQKPVEIKKSLKTEQFEPANNSSENSDLVDDKSSRKKGKNSKKHTHKKHSSQQEYSQKFKVTDPLYKEDKKKGSETDLSSQEDLQSINLDTVKREYESSDGHENTSPRKEKKQHNLKKHKDKKRKEIGHHSEVTENDSIPTDEKLCIGIQNIKQEILSDSNSETSKGIAKSRKKKASKQLPEDVKDCSSNKFSENLTKETLDIKPSLGLKTDEMVHLDHTTVKNEFPSTSIERKRNKKNKNKIEALQTTIKEEVLRDNQTNNDETIANANTSVVVKQEVLSDCDSKVSVKQEVSSDMYAPLSKVIKKEIKSEPDSDSSVTKKQCKRKHCENSEESYSENPDNLTGSCNKVKKLKMHKRSRH